MSHRCAILLTAASIAWAGGCGEGTTVVAAEGLILRELVDRTALEIDVARVPLAACASGEAPARGGTQWVCLDVEVDRLDDRIARVEALAAQFAELEARIAMLDVRLREEAEAIGAIEMLARALELGAGEVEAGRTSRPLSVPSAACRVSASSGPVDRSGGRTRAVSGAAVLYCPIFFPAETMRWNSVTHVLHDPDGFAAESRVSGYATYAPNPPARPIVGLDSNGLAGTATTTAQYALDPSLFDDGQYYFQQLLISSGASWFGQRWSVREPIAPPELAMVGGEIYVNATGDLPELVDARGRVWQRDENFLAPDQEPTRWAIEVGTVDQSLLTLTDLPNDVLRTERWCECDLRYQLRVPNGRYRVTTYFSENCHACASVSIGGTSEMEEPLHQITVAVEDQMVENYAPGLTAGSVYRATELVFEVEVGDGRLDITSRDIGDTWPRPGDSMMKGFVVRRIL